MTGVTRDGLLARQRRAAVVAACFEVAVVAARTEVAAGTQAWTVARLRCEQPHRGGRRPVLAELYATEQGILFVSRIEWLPSDHLNRRPWDAESLLLRVDVAQYADDEALAGAVESLTGPIFEPPEGSGPRWLRDAAPTFICEVLDLAGTDDDARALWTRCQDHPNAARKWTRSELTDRLLRRRRQ